MGRDHCKACFRPKGACYCHLIRPIENQTEVLVIQHPDERKKAMSTLPIVSLSLGKLSIYRTLDLNDPQFAATTEGGGVALLFPRSHGVDAIDIANAQACEIKRLVVLDGTWRNVRELIARNPVLNGLPRLTFNNPPKSRYRIRKAPDDNSLSTVESVSHALEAIDQVDCSSMLDAFEYLVEYQIDRMGRETYKKNYME